MSDNPPPLVVGTAGHIDHGKSRIVLALTGVDPDRLPEEKSRGMTIDIGFAHIHLEGCEVSFVDVPGHERFIHNMVAGSTGVDLAMLVVAADDSIMPQTREHAEVLSLLGVSRCLLVLTKMDLVDDEWADAVEQEARELAESTGLEVVSCVRTSAEDGRGIGDLRAAIASLAKDPSRPTAPYCWFRMPIDRAFVVPGRGTVVTGSVAHGNVGRDEELDVWPQGEPVRVRDLQTHYDARSVASGRMRLAMNLAGVAVDEVCRGHELATMGYLGPSRVLTVWLPTFRMPGKTPRKNVRLRLHIATSDVLAELRLMDRPDTTTCHEVYGQLLVAEPVVATWGQRFILRDEAASRTLGGGQIVRPMARRWTARRPPDAGRLDMLRSGKPRARLEEAVRDCEWAVPTPALLSSLAGLADAHEVDRLTHSLCDKGEVHVLGTGAQQQLVHRDMLERLCKDLNRRLAAYLEANPRLPGVPRAEWANWMPRACPPKLRPTLAEWCLANEAVGVSGEHIVPKGHRGALSSTDQALFDAMLGEIHAGAFQPPGIAELECRTTKNEKRLRELVDLAVARGQLVRLADGIWLHADRWTQLVERVTEALRGGRRLKVADIRTLLDSSRKYVVPIAEQLDAAGITKREGDERVLGPKATA